MIFKDLETIVNSLDHKGLYKQADKVTSIMRSLIKNAQEESATKSIKNRRAEGKIPSWWQLEGRLKKEGLIVEGQALAFFCPVYFAGQKIVKKLLDEKDEHGEGIIFPLPKIYNAQRVEVGLKQMRALGIKNPERLLHKSPKKGLGLRTYSSLPGIEGANLGLDYEYIGYEAVQLGAFQIVPVRWLNAGDPYNDSYRFPGETGYSPYWRIPSYKEFQDMRPDMAKNWKKTPGGIVHK